MRRGKPHEQENKSGRCLLHRPVEVRLDARKIGVVTLKKSNATLQEWQLKKQTRWMSEDRVEGYGGRAEKEDRKYRTQQHTLNATMKEQRKSNASYSYPCLQSTTTTSIMLPHAPCAYPRLSSPLILWVRRQMQTHTHTHTYAHAHTHTHTHTNTHTCTDICIHMHVHINPYARVNVRRRRIHM